MLSVLVGGAGAHPEEGYHGERDAWAIGLCLLEAACGKEICLVEEGPMPAEFRGVSIDERIACEFGEMLCLDQDSCLPAVCPF